MLYLELQTFLNKYVISILKLPVKCPWKFYQSIICTVLLHFIRVLLYILLIRVICVSVRLGLLHFTSVSFYILLIRVICASVRLGLLGTFLPLISALDTLSGSLSNTKCCKYLIVDLRPCWKKDTLNEHCNQLKHS